MFRPVVLSFLSVLVGCGPAPVDLDTDAGALPGAGADADTGPEDAGAPPPIPDGCPYVGVLSRACYLLDEASGTGAYDYSGWGNHGTYTNGPTLGGGCASFDGSNDHVAAPYGSSYDIGTSDLSVSAWVYQDSDGTSGVRVVLDHRSSSPRGFEVFLYYGKPALQLATSAGYTNFVAPSAISANTWHHVVVSVDRDSPTGVKFYVDGVDTTYSGNPTARTGSLANTTGLTLARTSATAGSYFKGDLCNVAVYNAAFTAAQAASQYAMGR